MCPHSGHSSYGPGHKHEDEWFGQPIQAIVLYYIVFQYVNQ